MAFPCFNEFFDLFYPNGIKAVPANIGELLTPVGLAFWIMDDGGYSHGNLLLLTNSFTLEELLVNILQTQFNLECKETLRRPGQYANCIPKREQL